MERKHGLGAGVACRMGGSEVGRYRASRSAGLGCTEPCNLLAEVVKTTGMEGQGLKHVVYSGEPVAYAWSDIITSV